MRNTVTSPAQIPFHEREERGERDGEYDAEQQMDINSVKHMDPIHQWFALHLPNLLILPQILPILRSIHSRHRLPLQRRRLQRRPTLRPPLLRRHHHHRRRPQGAVDRAFGGRNPVLRGVLYDVDVGGRSGSAAARAGDVSVHVGGGSRSEFL